MDDASTKPSVQAKPPATLPIFEPVQPGTEWAPEPGGQPKGVDGAASRGRGLRERTTRVVEVSVQTLSENMASFVEGVSAMLAAGTRAAGAYEVDAVEIECQISGSGMIGFAGAGVGVQGSSTLRMIFRKRQNLSPNE